MGEPHMTFYADYYELPYVPDCPECGSHLDTYGECHTCMLDEYMQEEAA